MAAYVRLAVGKASASLPCLGGSRTRFSSALAPPMGSVGLSGPLLGFRKPFGPERRNCRLLNPSLSTGHGRNTRAPNPTRTRAASTVSADSWGSASTFRTSPAMAEPEVEVAAATGMETEAPAAAGQKREREEGDDPAADGSEAAAEEAAKAKKLKVEEEAKEAQEEAEEGKAEETEEANEEKAVVADAKPVKLGPKEFTSAVEMFDYFFALLHSWTPQLEFNKYEQMVLEDLLKKGHTEPAKKIGAGVEAFEIRNHPVWQSRCFFVRRIDGSADDFSFRKCVDNILPLPEDMKIGNGKKSGGHHKGGGGGRGGGRGGGGRGGWRGGRGRGRRGG